MEIPVFLVTGFLESGKSSFIIETLKDEEFSAGEKTLLICLEEGEVEYDEEFLASKNVTLVTVDDKEDFTEEFLKEWQDKVKPERVMIEYNGTWQINDLLDLRVPKGWIMVQVITLIDASTYQVYLSNMRQMMVEQMSQSDLIIFNRCGGDIRKGALRRSVKIVNKRAQIIYENENGEVDQNDDEMLFDLTSDFIEVPDDDYGLWYMDITDKLDKYVGKTVKIKGMVYRNKSLSDDVFVPGRFAMTCCADDMTFIGFVSKYEDAYLLDNKKWVYVTATVKKEFHECYNDVGPVLYVTRLEDAKEPEEKEVYFS